MPSHRRLWLHFKSSTATDISGRRASQDIFRGSTRVESSQVDSSPETGTTTNCISAPLSTLTHSFLCKYFAYQHTLYTCLRNLTACPPLTCSPKLISSSSLNTAAAFFVYKEPISCKSNRFEATSYCVTSLLLCFLVDYREWSRVNWIAIFFFYFNKSLQCTTTAGEQNVMALNLNPSIVWMPDRITFSWRKVMNAVFVRISKGRRLENRIWSSNKITRDSCRTMFNWNSFILCGFMVNFANSRTLSYWTREKELQSISSSLHSSRVVVQETFCFLYF